MALFRKAEAPAETPDHEQLAVPPGFRPLPPKAVGAIIEGLAQRFMSETQPPRGGQHEPMTLALGLNGRQGEPDAQGKMHPEYLIRLDIPARPRLREFEPASQHNPSSTFTVDIPGAVFEQLAQWYIDDRHPARTWKLGTPWPVMPSPGDQWQPIAPRAVTTIRRQHADVASSRVRDSLGRAIGGNFLCLYDPTDGRLIGTSMTPEAELARPREQCVAIRAAVHPDDCDWDVLRVDPATSEVHPWPVPVRQEVLV